MSNKKYFWLKLQRDFFKRHDTMIIESMENGKDYLLFYLKLLVESIDHEGELRFSDTIPYNEKMLSTITNTNIDIVRTAVKVFSELGMIEMLDDGTIFMNQIDKMIGNETNKAESMRKLRAERKEVTLLPDVTKCYTEKEKEKEKDKELEKDIDINTDFELWWSEYPKKTGKKHCKSKYIKLYKSNLLPTLKDHIEIINRWKVTEKWIAGYIHNPLTWLNGERWNDDIPNKPKVTQSSKNSLDALQQMADNSDELLRGEII